MIPKRKRADSAKLQTDMVIDDSTHASEPESPRTIVAENLFQLRIHDTAGAQSQPAQSVSHVSRKRTSQDPDAAHHVAMEHSRALVTPPKDRPSPDRMEEVLEIGETPGAYDRTRLDSCLLSSPPTSPSPSLSPLSLEPPVGYQTDDMDLSLADDRGRSLTPRAEASYRDASHTSGGRMSKCSLSQEMDAFVNQQPGQRGTRRFSKPATTPITAPPPPTPLTSPGEEAAQEPLITKAAARMLSIPTLPLADTSPPAPSLSKRRKSSPLPAAAHASLAREAHHPTLDPSANHYAIDRGSMTWKDSEITGHLWNPDVDEDDDGEGVNGIGFRPTAAMDWKRKENRKRQINEWLAREAKEDRRRRFERRKRGSAGSASGPTQPGLRGLNCTGSSDGSSNGSSNDDTNNKNNGDNALDEAPGRKRVRVRFAETN